tara:strand:- start:108 stop:497 length:390 start_codon:yes stop_codon:yes gene_type:complete
MSILDEAQIGNSVKVNIHQSKDRLDKEVIEAINISSIGEIRDFRITDGKGIGVILKLSNGKEQWFFDNEIDILDKNGNIIDRNIDKNEDINFIFEMIKNLKYQNKNKIIELINPINFMVWLIVSFKDIF